ncbi:MAG: 2,4-diaminopentanoate dehydrogenase [Synergistota bacterium]|nr:2,4-diaminopentanoate dehydrogenase [Synergistota bacterium]
MSTSISRRPGEPVRVIVAGLGAMGSGIAKLLLDKEGIEIAAAAVSRKEKQGKDMGDLLGLEQKTGVITTSSDEAFSVNADIVIQATTSFAKETCPEILEFVKSGKNVISIAEEMSYPHIVEPELASRMDQAARESGVAILGTGINPGFILDTLILTLTAPFQRVLSIKASRVNDLSPFGHGVMNTQGVGTSPEEFDKGLKEGKITGHIGFLQSVNMIADALGWELDEIIESREPIISSVHRETPHVKIEPGMVAGCNHTAKGMKYGEAVIWLEHPQQVHPQLAGVETGDYINIRGDASSLNMAIKPEIPGGTGTMSMAVNMIPHVLNARPGLLSMLDLPFPRAMSSRFNSRA